MSNYCTDCHYDVAESLGERACPFNALYWDFIARHATRFEANPRMAMPLRGFNKMPPEKTAGLRQRAKFLLAQIEQGEMI